MASASARLLQGLVVLQNLLRAAGNVVVTLCMAGCRVPGFGV